MAVRNKTELMDSVKKLIGDSTDDDSISILEDMADTLDDYDTRLSDSTNWKGKYEENDAAWRQKYTERFFSQPAPNATGIPPGDYAGPGYQPNGAAAVQQGQEVEKGYDVTLDTLFDVQS